MVIQLTKIKYSKWEIIKKILNGKTHELPSHNHITYAKIKTMRFKIAGNGAFGTALSKILPNNILVDSLVDVVVEQDEILIPAVSSNAVYEVIEKSLKKQKPRAIILVSKGIAKPILLSEEIKTIPGVAEIPVLFFAGPNLAKEIMTNNNKLLSATIAGPKKWTSAFKKSVNNLILDETEDLVALQVASIVKNLTAFLIGYLQLDENSRATIITQGIKESIALALHLGTSEKDFIKNGIIGDIILTCCSEFSRNFQAGKNFEKSLDSISQNSGQSDVGSKNLKPENAGPTQESLNSIKYVMELKGDLKSPIIDLVNDIITNSAVMNKQNFVDNFLKNF